MGLTVFGVGMSHLGQMLGNQPPPQVQRISHTVPVTLKMQASKLPAYNATAHNEIYQQHLNQTETLVL